MVVMVASVALVTASEFIGLRDGLPKAGRSFKFTPLLLET